MPLEMERTGMIAFRWLQFRHAIASFFMGYNIHNSIDQAYEEGRRWGQMEGLRMAVEAKN